MAKIKVPKPRCSGTLTESGFFGWIRSGLRRMSIKWRPKNDYLKSIRRPYNGKDKRTKWEYPCEQCGKWFIRAHTEIDHRIPCGSLTCFDDIGGFVERLFVEKDGWRLLCKPCHRERTNEHRLSK